MVLKLREGNAIPLGYGVAFVDPPTRTAVCYPIPLHLVIRRLRNWLIDISKPPEDVQAEIFRKQLEERYNQGIAEGERRQASRLQSAIREEWSRGVAFGFEHGLNESRNKMVEVITEEIKAAMAKEIHEGRWWTLPPEEH